MSASNAIDGNSPIPAGTTTSDISPINPSEAVQQFVADHAGEIDSSDDGQLTWHEVSKWTADHTDLVKQAGLEANLLATDDSGNIKPRGFSWQKLAEASGSEQRQSKSGGSYFTFNITPPTTSNSPAPSPSTDNASAPSLTSQPSGSLAEAPATNTSSGGDTTITAPAPTAPLIQNNAPDLGSVVPTPPPPTPSDSTDTTDTIGNESETTAAPAVADEPDSATSAKWRTTDAKDKVWIALNVIDVADGGTDDNRATIDSLSWVISPDNHTLDNFPDLKRTVEFFVANQSDTALLEQFGFTTDANGNLGISTTALVMAAIDQAGDGDNGKPDGWVSAPNLVAASNAGLLNGDDKFAERLRDLNDLVQSVLNLNGNGTTTDQGNILGSLGFSQGNWIMGTQQLQQGIEDGTLVGDTPL